MTQSLYVNTLLGGGAMQPSETGFNYGDPYDNLYAFGKIWAGYEQPVIGAFHGLMYGRVGTARMQPLFGYTGTGLVQAKVAENGDLLLKSRETGYFTDLETGDILEHWYNPYTEETVEVYHFYNDCLIGRIGPSMPTLLMDSKGGSPTLINEGTVFPNASDTTPFTLPFQQYGDDLMVSWDYTHSYENPVNPEYWPRASTGKIISPSEHFTLQVNRTELEDRDLPTVRMTGGFTRVSQWWPFMRMGGTPFADGVLFGRCFSHKGLTDYGDIPQKLFAYLEKHAPEQLTFPDDSWEPRMERIDTWKAYAQDMDYETAPNQKRRQPSFIVPTGCGRS
ncbi:DUF1838 family protein [Temperatibacter marinus]|uniref:DUF1838 family protein n=1 Tax=Temperatibacter marinus TaxID=1456591 RepID=A0AA52EK94_9PROT|nr:DUF1838 family protein [Temperatibacter marinus]WND03566.1 DUF1838 family protein [Temperatibacter marinus]